MSKFGLISPVLFNEAISSRHLWQILPEKWQFRFSPLKTSPISGQLSGAPVPGFGWKIPASPAQIWSFAKIGALWQKLLLDWENKQVKVIGLDAEASFLPPVPIRTGTNFPGISDGKAFELLLFITRFRNLLRNYEIAPLKTKVLIIWEEGNLGLTCARLIAREVRFLTLINPDQRKLERAADLLIAETGISPRIKTNLPADYYGIKILIKCGELPSYQLSKSTRQLIWCELFQKYHSLLLMNLDLPISAGIKERKVPFKAVLGEAILRAHFDLNYGFWFGSELPLERVLKLALLFKELGMRIAV